MVSAYIIVEDCCGLQSGLILRIFLKLVTWVSMVVPVLFEFVVTLFFHLWLGMICSIRCLGIYMIVISFIEIKVS